MYVYAYIQRYTKYVRICYIPGNAGSDNQVPQEFVCVRLEDVHDFPQFICDVRFLDAFHMEQLQNIY